MIRLSYRPSVKKVAKNDVAIYEILCNTYNYMEFKDNIKTIRLDKKESSQINLFLKDHPYIHQFSTLVRAAVWEYIKNHSASGPNDPLSEDRPSFLWEYNLNRGEIHEILNGPQKKRLWLVAKILEHAKWEEVWKFLTLEQIKNDLPLLRLPEKTKKHWEHALKLWR